VERTKIPNHSQAAAWNELTEIEPYEIQVFEVPASFASLELAINRAVSELQGQGAKSNRIAIQLLTALALFHQEIGS
jgi:hypothetical protein